MQQKSRYKKISYLGEGQFANVYQARDVDKGTLVAIKKIKLGTRHEARDGINRTALREIKLLQEIRHDNVITLLDVIGRRNSIQLVFDFMETDLENLIRKRDVMLQQSHVKNIMKQVLLGLEHLHLNFILHRDLKPNNLLLNSQGRVKIADFGLARFYGSPNRVYTHQVVTRWYRAPELLYGARQYGTGIDMWSIGCIVAELLLRVPLFPGESDIDQLLKITEVLGTPTDEQWPNHTKLPDYIKLIDAGPPRNFRMIFTAAGNDLLELIQQCLHYNPLARWNATQALRSTYFRSEPYACSDSQLPIIEGRKKRQAMRDTAGEPPTTRRKLDF